MKAKDLEVVNIIDLVEKRTKSRRADNWVCYYCKRSRDCSKAFTSANCETQDRSLLKFHLRKAGYEER